jgi:hypothetical protein
LGDPGAPAAAASYTINVTGARLSLAAEITKTNADATINVRKVGTGTLEVRHVNGILVARHDDTIISGGTISYLGDNAGDTFSFGNGVITLDGGTFGFHGITSDNYTLTNRFNVTSNGGELDFTRGNPYNNPNHIFTGAIGLGGDLKFSAGSGSSRLELRGDITVTGGDRTIIANPFNGTGIVISGNILEDVVGRTVTFNATSGGLSIAGGSNHWTGDTVITGNRYGIVGITRNATFGTGRVIVKSGGRLSLSSTGNASGTGKVTVEAGGMVNFGYDSMGYAKGLAEIDPGSQGMLDPLDDPVGLDLDAGGHAGLFIGARTGLQLQSGWVPQAHTYRIAGGIGGAELDLMAPDILTGRDNALVHGSAENVGTTVVVQPQDFGGGTTVAAGTLDVRGAGTLGSGPINVIGGKLTVSGSIAGAASLSVSGAGSVFQVAASQSVPSVVGANGARVQFSTGGALTLRVASANFQLSSGASLDLSHGALIVDGGSPDSLRQLIVSGRNGGAWNGAGVLSGAAAIDHKLTVGYAIARQLLGENGGTFLGQQVGADALLVRATLTGDSNLDGNVDFQDLVALAQHYNTVNPLWSAGDFNYDDSVDFSDLVLLAQNYNSGLPAVASVAGSSGFQEDFNAAFATVPEPVATCFVPVAMVLLARRRRR